MNRDDIQEHAFKTVLAQYKLAGFLSGGVRSGHALSNAASSAWNVASNLNTAGKNLQVPIGQRWGDVASNSWRHFNEQGGGKALGDLAMRGGAVAGTAALAGGALRMTGVGGQQQQPVAVTQPLNKWAFAVTDEGHRYDAAVYRALADAHDKIQGANKTYADQAPVRSMLTLDPLAQAVDELYKRHMNYSAARHEKGENALNPFGGFLTPTTT